MPTLDACGVLIGDYCSHIEMGCKQSQSTARWLFALENVNTKAVHMNIIMWLSFLLFSLKRRSAQYICSHLERSTQTAVILGRRLMFLG